MPQVPAKPNEPTPVDDVRVVRETLDGEAQGIISALAEQSRAAIAQYSEVLTLKLVKAHALKSQRDDKAG